MAYTDEKLAQARAMVGRRVEIPVHFDLWMRGARFGVVTSFGRDAKYVLVKMDHPQVKRQVRVARVDFDYMLVL
jgi:hypothetical protein